MSKCETCQYSTRDECELGHLNYYIDYNDCEDYDSVLDDADVEWKDEEAEAELK